jgi:hypothetical protein
VVQAIRKETSKRSRQSEKRQARGPGNQKRDKQESQAIRKEASKRPRQSEKRQARGPGNQKRDEKKAQQSVKR